MDLDTICIDVNELPGDVMLMENMCADNIGEHVIVDFVEQTNCITSEAIEAGEDLACIVTCDDYIICDTTYVMFSISPMEGLELESPVAFADTFYTSQGMSLIENPMGNDQLNGILDSAYVLGNGEFGYASFLTDGSFEYRPNGTYCDSQTPDEVKYVICNTTACDTSSIIIYTSCKDLKFFNAFSPNGDGTNETFFH